MPDTQKMWIALFINDLFCLVSVVLTGSLRPFPSSLKREFLYRCPDLEFLLREKRQASFQGGLWSYGLRLLWLQKPTFFPHGRQHDWPPNSQWLIPNASRLVLLEITPWGSLPPGGLWNVLQVNERIPWECVKTYQDTGYWTLVLTVCCSHVSFHGTRQKILSSVPLLS